MKIIKIIIKIIISIVLVGLVLGCELQAQEESQQTVTIDFTEVTNTLNIDAWLKSKLANTPYPNINFSGVHDYSTISDYINSNITFMEEPEGVDIWQTPEEAWYNSQGDCEEFTLLYMAILYKEYNQYSWAIACNDTRVIVDGGDVNHLYVLLMDGTIINPMTGKVEDLTIGYKYFFYTVYPSEFNDIE